jgi:2-methylaconitate cis-trans-isomerase PrpF
VDVIDRTKDDESKRFKSHNIEFDFSILVRIKEAIVDLSSNCIEIALKVLTFLLHICVILFP